MHSHIFSVFILGKKLNIIYFIYYLHNLKHTKMFNRCQRISDFYENLIKSDKYSHIISQQTGAISYIKVDISLHL